MSWSSAATASSSRSGQPTARPISVGGVLGRHGVDAEALRPQLPAAVGLEEVEDAARCRRSPGPPRASAPRPRPGRWRRRRRLPQRLAKRRTEIVSATSDSTASTRSPIRAVSAVAASHDPGAGLDQDREPLDGLERGSKAGAGRRGRFGPALLGCFCLGKLLVEFDRANCALRKSHRQQRTLGLATSVHKSVENLSRRCSARP